MLKKPKPTSGSTDSKEPPSSTPPRKGGRKGRPAKSQEFGKLKRLTPQPSLSESNAKKGANKSSTAFRNLVNNIIFSINPNPSKNNPTSNVLKPSSKTVQQQKTKKKPKRPFLIDHENAIQIQVPKASGKVSGSPTLQELLNPTTPRLVKKKQKPQTIKNDEESHPNAKKRLPDVPTEASISLVQNTAPEKESSDDDDDRDRGLPILRVRPLASILATSDDEDHDHDDMDLLDSSDRNNNANVFTSKTNLLYNTARETPKPKSPSPPNLIFATKKNVGTSAKPTNSGAAVNQFGEAGQNVIRAGDGIDSVEEGSANNPGGMTNFPRSPAPSTNISNNKSPSTTGIIITKVATVESTKGSPKNLISKSTTVTNQQKMTSNDAADTDDEIEIIDEVWRAPTRQILVRPPISQPATPLDLLFSASQQSNVEDSEALSSSDHVNVERSGPVIMDAENFSTPYNFNFEQNFLRENEVRTSGGGNLLEVQQQEILIPIPSCSSSAGVGMSPLTSISTVTNNESNNEVARRRVYLHQLDPNDFSTNPDMQKRIKRSIAVHSAQLRKRRQMELQEENAQLRGTVTALSNYLTELGKKCKLPLLDPKVVSGPGLTVLTSPPTGGGNWVKVAPGASEALKRPFPPYPPQEGGRWVQVVPGGLPRMGPFHTKPNRAAFPRSSAERMRFRPVLVPSSIPSYCATGRPPRISLQPQPRSRSSGLAGHAYMERVTQWNLPAQSIPAPPPPPAEKSLAELFRDFHNEDQEDVDALVAAITNNANKPNK